MSLEFAHLTDDVRRGFLDFLTATLGRVLVYRDHLGRSWRGFVSKPDFGMTQTSRNQSSIQIEFQIIPEDN